MPTNTFCSHRQKQKSAFAPPHAPTNDVFGGGEWRLSKISFTVRKKAMVKCNFDQWLLFGEA